MPARLRLEVFGGKLDIMGPAVCNHCPFVIPGLPFYFGRRAHYYRFGRDLEAGRQQGTRGNKRAFPDLAAIQ